MTEEKRKINKLRGARVQEVRKRAGLSQVELAERIFCQPNYISMIERGDRGLTLENADLIAKVCGVRSDYLLLRSDYKSISEEFSKDFAKYMEQNKLSVKLFEMILLSHGYGIGWSDIRKNAVLPDECTIKDSDGFEIVLNVHEDLFPLFETYERHFLCDIQHMIGMAKSDKEEEDLMRELREEDERNG